VRQLSELVEQKEEDAMRKEEEARRKEEEARQQGGRYPETRTRNPPEGGRPEAPREGAPRSRGCAPDP
jgi:hypothetical protein